MPILSRRSIIAVATFCGLLTASSFAGLDRAAADNLNLLQTLRAGGLVIVVRHGATFPPIHSRACVNRRGVI